MRSGALPGREMGKKRRQEKTNAGTLKAAPVKAASAEDVAALAAASAPADADAVDQRVDYTDQHGTHWVADAGALQPIEQAAAELWSMRARQTHGRCADGNWVEYDELKAYEDGQSESGPRSRKHKKGRKGRGQAKPPKKYLIPPMQ